MRRNGNSAIRNSSFVLCSALIVCACTSNEDDYSQITYYGETFSPDGEVKASIHHYDSSNGGLTQVGLDFVGLGCGAGSVSWYEYDIGIEMRWVDAETLEVKYPDGKPYKHNASGDLLGCFNRSVRVVMDPRPSTELGHGAYSKPIKTGHTLSPDGDISAYTFRYDSPQGGITQVVVQFPDERGCDDSAATFYAHDVELQLNWIDNATLEILYPEGQRYDLPPWGSTVRCVTRDVEVMMRSNL